MLSTGNKSVCMHTINFVASMTIFFSAIVGFAKKKIYGSNSNPGMLDNLFDFLIICTQEETYHQQLKYSAII